MRNVILAALLALATATPAIVPAEAASLTITTDNNNDRWESNNWHDNGHHYGWRRHHRRHDMGFGLTLGDNSRRDYRECDVTTHRYWRDGRLIVERTRDCY